MMNSQEPQKIKDKVFKVKQKGLRSSKIGALEVFLLLWYVYLGFNLPTPTTTARILNRLDASLFTTR